MRTNDQMRKDAGLENFRFTPNPRNDSSARPTPSADLREVWKRLAADSVMVPIYGNGGALSTEFIWAQRVTWPRPFLGLHWPSAMQGCRE